MGDVKITKRWSRPSEGFQPSKADSIMTSCPFVILVSFLVHFFSPLQQVFERFFLVPQIPNLLLHFHSLFDFTYPSAKKIKILSHRTPQFPSFPTHHDSLEPHPVTTSRSLEEELSLTFIKCIFIGHQLFARQFPLTFLFPHLPVFSSPCKSLLLELCHFFCCFVLQNHL